MTINKNTDLEFSIQQNTEKGGVYTNFYTEDKGSASIRIRLSSNGYYLDLTKTDLKPVLFLFQEDGSIFEIRDYMGVMPEQGLIQYNFSDNVMRHPGKIKAKVFLKNDTKSVHVANFTFDIKDSGIEGAVGKEIKVELLEDIVRNVMTDNAMGLLDDEYKEKLDNDLKNYLVENKEDFKGEKGNPLKYEDLTDNQKEELKGEPGQPADNEIVAELIKDDVAPVLSEVETARGGKTNLNSRLDDISDFSSRNVEQTDFVDKLKGLNSYDSVQVKRSNNTTFSVSNINTVANRHMTNVFTKNANDDYYILSESYVGSLTSSELPKEYVNYTKVSGTIDTQYATHFGTEIGTKITVTISGSEIYFRRYGDNRGGVWEFTLDGDVDNKIKISTFKSTAGTDDVKLFSGLTDTVHTIDGEFIGDDSQNAPSGGVSRAWLSFSSTTETTRTFSSRFVNKNIVREKNLNTAMSNKDFALRIRPKGSTGEYHFVPEHNAIGTAFKINDTKILLDDKPLDISSLPVGISQVGKNFKIIQSVYGKYPSGDNLIRIDNIHAISLDGSVRLMGKIEVLKDIEIQDGYFLMLPVSTDVATRLKTSRHNNYPTTKTDGSRTNLTNEKDDTTSFIFTSSTNTNLYSAMTVHDPYRSIRTGKTDKYPVGQTAWIEHRNTSMQKLYQSIYRLATITAGTELNYDGSYISGELDNVHNMY